MKAVTPDGKRYILRGAEKLTMVFEFEWTIRAAGKSTLSANRRAFLEVASRIQ
jgi:hypothetical protein